jgi:diguanylate cyclase (GGDEF)-like protein
MYSISSRAFDVFRRRHESDAGHVRPAALAATLGLLFSVSAFLVISHRAGQLAPWMVLIASLSVSMIMAAYLWSSGRHAKRLQIANDQLDRTNGALEAANQQLLAQNTRFDAALNNMSQGLLMFDAAERIVVCNDRYIKMYRLSPEVVKPGLSLIDLLRYRVASGHLNSDPEQYRAEILAGLASGKATTFITEMMDGRQTLAAVAPMAGGGWVATHEDITELRSAEAKISYMVHHDTLTKLPNRLLFHDELQRALAGAKPGECLAVFCLDLDHFKSVNDTLGHPIGDRLLAAAAERLRQCVRDSDVVARLGGDEFAIVQIGAPNPTDATLLAASLIEAISAPYEFDGHQFVVGLSIGIAVAPDDGLDPDQLLKNADMALHRAKADGRGTYRFFEPEMDARMHARRSLDLDLRKAIAKGEFELFYQPQVDVQTRRVRGFEALVRWRHPRRGMIGPTEFISLAEETGLIIPLGDWVLRRACAEAAAWPSDVKIAVNLSPIQFKSKNLLPSVLSALAYSGLSPNRLELEITETILLQDSDATLETLHKLRDLGVKISMDDFGTGYSSLSYLRKFPFDKIKIDQSFIREMSVREDCLTIVRTVAAMGASLGIVTTAEGVETFEQFEQLKLEGYNEVQGDLFSPPRPDSEIKDLLNRINKRLKAA